LNIFDSLDGPFFQFSSILYRDYGNEIHCVISHQGCPPLPLGFFNAFLTSPEEEVGSHSREGNEGQIFNVAEGMPFFHFRV
jgi:hypothetical protein